MSDKNKQKLPMAKIDTRSTKIGLDKIFDTASDSGFDGATFAAYAFIEYYQILKDIGLLAQNPDKISKGLQFDDIEKAKRRISIWRDLREDKLPGAYERYLVLSRLFSCGVDDLICLSEADGKLSSASFKIAATQNSKGLFEIYLPVIKEKRFGKAMLDVNYVAADKLWQDGATLTDKIISYTQSKKEKIDIIAATKYLKENIIKRWKDGRDALGMEAMITFCQLTGLKYSDLYKETEEHVSMDLSLEQKSLDSMGGQMSKRFGDLISQYKKDNGLEVHKEANDYIIMRGGTGKSACFGLIALVDGDLCYSPAKYQHIVKHGKYIYAIEDGSATIVKTQPFEKASVASKSFGQADALRLQLLKIGAFAKILKSIKCDDGYCVSSEEGLVVIDSSGRAHLCRKQEDSHGLGQIIIANINGKERFGLIADTGLVIPPIYEVEIKYGEGFYTIKKKGKYGLLDSNGDAVIEPTFDEASVLSGSLVAVKKGKKWGYANNQGEIIITPQFDFACDFHEGLACVTIKGKDGYIDKTGKIVIKPQFDSGYRFSEGIAAIEQDGKYGFIDTKGSIKIKTIYEGATTCSRGIVQVISGGNLIKKEVVG